MQIDTESYTSPNFNDRPVGMVIDSLTIHTTEGPWPTDIEWLCSKHSDVSCGYVIAPDGKVYQIVPDEKRAWHAGTSYYAGRNDYNDFSIGIEISHKKGQKYPPVQLAALDQLCRLLIPVYSIPAELIVKHAWIRVPYGERKDPTDWTDADFNKWVKSLYSTIEPIDPLRVRSIPGIDRVYYCGVGFYNTYTQNNGMWWLGYPHSDEIRSVDQTGRDCTYMSFERATLKYNSQEGIRTALESEAIALGWI